MSRNVYIWWDKDINIPDIIVRKSDQPVGQKKDKPGQDAVHRELTAYIGNFGADIWIHSRGGIFVTFPTSFSKYGEGAVQRNFEVHVSDDAVCVTTREMDDITNAIATGFGRRVAIKFRGRYDDQ